MSGGSKHNHVKLGAVEGFGTYLEREIRYIMCKTNGQRLEEGRLWS